MGCFWGVCFLCLHQSPTRSSQPSRQPTVRQSCNPDTFQGHGVPSTTNPPAFGYITLHFGCCPMAPSSCPIAETFRAPIPLAPHLFPLTQVQDCRKGDQPLGGVTGSPPPLTRICAEPALLLGPTAPSVHASDRGPLCCPKLPPCWSLTPVLP